MPTIAYIDSTFCDRWSFSQRRSQILYTTNNELYAMLGYRETTKTEMEVNIYIMYNMYNHKVLGFSTVIIIGFCQSMFSSSV